MDLEQLTDLEELLCRFASYVTKNVNSPIFNNTDYLTVCSATNLVNKARADLLENE